MDITNLLLFVNCTIRFIGFVKNKKMTSKFNFKILALLMLGITLFATDCVKNPVTGKKDLMLLSEKQEIAMGKQSDPGVVASFGLYQNDRMQKFIQEKGQEMAAISHRPNLNYEFKILDSPVVNAFAVPGGYVYFTRGIMAHFNNEAEFAGVLGHETGHITARHGARQYTKQMLGQLGFMVGMIASKDFRQFADVAYQGLGLLFLKFSRDNETEADRLGVEYSTKIGYDAREMAHFFETLGRLSGGPENRIPTFQSTHPDPADRFNKTKRLAREWQAKTTGSKFNVNRNQYLRMIDGLVYGEDPRQGFVENNNFYHPELKFWFPVPQGWQTQNSPQAFQMAPKDGKAMMMLTVAQGKTLTAAASETLEQFGLTEVSRKNTNVNGLSALELMAEKVPTAEEAQQAQQSGEKAKTLSTISYLIQYNGLIYNLTGLTYKETFSSYKSRFLNTMTRFDKLTDQDKINRQPERIKIVTATQNGTLKDALRYFKIPSSRFEEFAILNGMELTTPVSKGMLIKVIGQ